MANLDTTVIDIGAVALRDEKFRDELLAAPGAKTYLAGTVLARRSVNAAVVAAPGANTGNGTVTAASVIAGTVVPVPGAYTLRCVAAVANGGVFNLINPSGQVVQSGLTMTPGAGAATQFKASGLQFTVTDGTTDFVPGDTFTLTVSADGKVVALDTAGAAGAQNAYAVLTYPIVAAGAGNIPIRALIAGEVNRNRLVLDADGTGINIDANIIEALRRCGIIVTDVQQLARLDNL